MELAQVAEIIESRYTDPSETAVQFPTESILADGQKFWRLVQQSEIPQLDRANNLAEFPEIRKNEFNAYGERIVAKLDSIGREFKANMERAHQEINKPVGQLSLVDSLKIQYDFAVVSLHIEVISKGVQKAVQNVDTLVKMQ